MKYSLSFFLVVLLFLFAGRETGLQPSSGQSHGSEPVGKPTASRSSRPVSSPTRVLPTPLPSQTPTLAPSSSAAGQGEVESAPSLITNDENLFLPDLVTLPPTDLRIRTNRSNGHKILRFTNSIMNIGPGKIELWGDKDPGTGRVTVTQSIYKQVDFTESVVVGEFFFHPEHDHWHLGNFASYEVLSFGPDGKFDTVVAKSDKISYCLRDDARSDIPGASRGQSYTSCDLKRQGISVGWIDIYRYHLPGQTIDITFLPDGLYALRSTVDPENSLWELDRSNNTSIQYFEVEGNKVNIVELPANYNRLLDMQQ